MSVLKIVHRSSGYDKVIYVNFRFACKSSQIWKLQYIVEPAWDIKSGTHFAFSLLVVSRLHARHDGDLGGVFLNLGNANNWVADSLLRANLISVKYIVL